MSTTLYTPENLNTVFKLRFGWTAWPSVGHFPAEPANDMFNQLHDQWENDGIRALRYRWQPEQIDFVFSVKPQLPPTLLASRAKGRIQWALRKSGTPCKFSRKVSVRSIGENVEGEVRHYVANQLGKENLINESYRDKLRQFSIVDPSIDFEHPTSSSHGRYWYDLHLVLVMPDRHRLNDLNALATIRDQCIQIGEEHGYSLGRLSILPDHLHAMIRGNIGHSAEELALNFLNGIANRCNRCMIYSPFYYVGTFGPYSMDLIRKTSVDV